MAVKDVFSAHLYLGDDSFEDITSGIVNIDILHGTEVYEGPFQQVDSGQFTIVSRNPNLDPKVNPNLIYQSYIEFRDSRNVEEGKSNVFFGGWVTDINVEYQRNDFPIITITGTDIFGLLQKAVINEDIIHDVRNWMGGVIGDPDENGVSLPYLINLDSWLFNSPATEEYITDATPGGLDPASIYDNYLGFAPARYCPELGESLLDVLNKYAKTNLNYFSVDHRVNSRLVKIYAFAKYNSFFWKPMQDPAIEFQTYQFSSDPADNRPYESILINNGYNRVTNSITISNETKTLEDPMDPFDTPIVSTTNTFGPYVDAASKTEYGTSRLNLDTIIPSIIVNDGDAERYSKDVFQVVGFISDEIQQITFNNGRHEDILNDSTYSFAKLNQFVRIKHQVSDTETIDRFYDIAGIHHNISLDKWEMTFTFKPSQQEIAFNYQGYSPTIQMNSLTGDTNFNFTATITDYPIEDIQVVIWCLNGTNSDIGQQWYYTINGERYKDFTQRSGLTQTWNFDDDGILAPNVETGGIGAGEWYVIPYIVLKNGWVIAPNVKLTVGTPEVEADFLWEQNLTNNFGKVTFTDDSHNNEIGEPDSYLWDFGDGATSTEKNPVHVYDPAPSQTTYDVSLRVFAYGVGGTKVYNTKTKTVTLAQPTMTANFTWVANNQVVTFTNTSINVGLEEPDAYLWEFGDGTTSTVKNPVKTFPVTDVNTPQSFSVKLTTRNIWEQTANVTKTVTTTALNKTGTYPVKYIKLRTDPYSRPGDGPGYFAITPQIYMLKGRTSNTLANLTANAQLVDFQDTYSPQLQWVTVSGDSPQSSLGLSGYLTRQSSNTQAMGCGSAQSFGGVVEWPTVRMELVLQIPTESQYLINDIIMRATTLYKRLGGNAGYHPEDFYPKIYVDVATTVTNYTPNPSGVYGPPTLNGDWVNIGYFKFAGGNVSTADYTMTALRPLPLNIPYFTYVFNPFGNGNDKQVRFDSVETADSYLWTFGTGATSTSKTPVYTYPSYDTYTVTLQVTNGGVVTRTTTEPVIVQPTVT
jgi:PKD repeat protein